MEIPINTSLGNNRDGADVGPHPDEGGGSGFRPDAMYREELDDALRQVLGNKDYHVAYAEITFVARALLKIGMRVDLMLEYQDKVADAFAKRNEPVAPVTNIDQQNNINTSTGPLKGNVGKQEYTLDKMPGNDQGPKLIE